MDQILRKSYLRISANRLTLKVKIMNLYYNILILCVWSFIDSAPGHDIDLRPVSLEPVWHGGGHRLKIFSEKWPVAKLPIKIDKSPMLSYGKSFVLINNSAIKVFYFPVLWTGQLSSLL